VAQRKPTPELRRFGAEVMRLRQDAGLTQNALAQAVNVTRAYVAQVEAGTTRCRRDFAERLDSALGTETTFVDAWDERLKSIGYPRWFVEYPDAEKTADLLRAYETMLVYGLFQTKAYIHALVLSEAACEGRLRRQTVLKRKEPPLISVVLAESVLWTCMGSADVMREQCEHLLVVSQWDNITLQIAPTAYYRGLGGPFNLATQSSGEDLLYMPTTRGGITSNDREDILPIVGAFSALQARALNADDSREFLRKAVVRWT
jgi:transcriptional regulator with XRE-family HTH domain